MEQLTKAMVLYKLDIAETFLWDAKIQLERSPMLLPKLKAIIDDVCSLRATIRGANDHTVEEFNDEPYEKSEKDCMWERE